MLKCLILWSLSLNCHGFTLDSSIDVLKLLFLDDVCDLKGRIDFSGQDPSLAKSSKRTQVLCVVKLTS